MCIMALELLLLHGGFGEKPQVEKGVNPVSQRRTSLFRGQLELLGPTHSSWSEWKKPFQVPFLPGFILNIYGSDHLFL